MEKVKAYFRGFGFLFKHGWSQMLLIILITAIVFTGVGVAVAPNASLNDGVIPANTQQVNGLTERETAEELPDVLIKNNSYTVGLDDALKIIERESGERPKLLEEYSLDKYKMYSISNPECFFSFMVDGDKINFADMMIILKETSNETINTQLELLCALLFTEDLRAVSSQEIIEVWGDAILSPDQKSSRTINGVYITVSFDENNALSISFY